MTDEMRTWLMKSLITRHIFIIATWNDPSDTKISIQDFHLGNLHYIPIFSTVAIAREQLKGTPYANQLKSIDGRLLFAMFRGDELLILNPGDGLHQQFRASEFKALIAQNESYQWKMPR